VAILVGLLSIYDAVDGVVERVYFRTFQQDATVTFAETQPIRAAGDLSRLPGVQRVEPFRAVAARAVSGHLEERVQLMGVDPAGRLTHALDREDRPIAPPEGGVALSARLAARLGLGVGDRLRVEVLEGRRPVADLPVVALIEDYVGLSVRLSRATLNDLMGEGPTASGAFLATDPALSDRLERRLKDIPAVAQVRLRRAELRTIEGNLSEQMRMVWFYVLFSGVIAFGVVYNSARIALSERGRELASLRVLGYTRFEVSYILLGELTILAVLALPLGCLMGTGIADLLTRAFDNDNFRIPLTVAPATYGTASLVVLAATAVSAMLVRRRIGRLDMVAVLKTRE
jgi:putative ABC transport system permease protein